MNVKNVVTTSASVLVFHATDIELERQRDGRNNVHHQICIKTRPNRKQINIENSTNESLKMRTSDKSATDFFSFRLFLTSFFDFPLDGNKFHENWVEYLELLHSGVSDFECRLQRLNGKRQKSQRKMTTDDRFVWMWMHTRGVPFHCDDDAFLLVQMVSMRRPQTQFNFFGNFVFDFISSENTEHYRTFDRIRRKTKNVSFDIEQWA